MQKIMAFFEAHWKPFLVAVAAGAVVLFLFARKKPQAAAAVTRPAAMLSGGGSSGGAPIDSSQSGNLGSTGAAGPTPVQMIIRQAGDLGQWVSDQWDSKIGGVPVRSDAAGSAAVSSILPFGASAPVIGQKAGPGPWGGQAIWEQVQLPGGQSGFVWSADIAGNPHPPVPGVARGSGFRGGDVYPAAWGDNRPIDARQAARAGLPAAPLGTAVAPPQVGDSDVRRAPRRQTSMAQVARGAPPRQLPQSFSVPIQQHVERKPSSVTVAAQAPVNALASGGGAVQVPVEQPDGHIKAPVLGRRRFR